MHNLALVKSENFGAVQCDFYRGKKEIWMTRKQIGEALEYADPQKAIDKIHLRHKERLDKFSVTLKLGGTDGKMYDTILYSAKGVYEICRWSQQPKANEFFDWVYDMLEGLRTGKIRMEFTGPQFTPRMALDVAKFVSKELKNNPVPNPVSLNILQEIFAQSGINVPLDEYRRKTEELKRAEEERMALSKKLRLQPGTILNGPNRVRELREARGWTQEYLAKKAKICRSSICYAESMGMRDHRKAKYISRRTWEGICKAFEMPMEEIFPAVTMDRH